MPELNSDATADTAAVVAVAKEDETDDDDGDDGVADTPGRVMAVVVLWVGVAGAATWDVLLGAGSNEGFSSFGDSILAISKQRCACVKSSSTMDASTPAPAQ